MLSSCVHSLTILVTTVPFTLSAIIVLLLQILDLWGVGHQMGGSGVGWQSLDVLWEMLLEMGLCTGEITTFSLLTCTNHLFGIFFHVLFRSLTIKVIK